MESVYDSARGVAAGVQEFLDTLGDDDKVIAVSVGKPTDSILDVYPESDVEVRILICTVAEDDTGGTVDASHINGYKLPARQLAEGAVAILDDVDELLGGGPGIQDVCVGRALEWVGTDAIDIDPRWREWPSEDIWYSILRDRDYSTE